MSLNCVARQPRGVGHGPEASFVAYVINTTNSTRKWATIDKTSAAISYLSAISGTTQTSSQHGQWQPSGNYFLCENSSQTPKASIMKAVRDTTSLTVLTSGIPTWSNFKTDAVWAGDDYILVCGESSVYVEAATRSGDTFTAVSSPLDVQHGINVFCMAVSPNNQTLVTGGIDAGSGAIRTYSRSGDTWVFQHGYSNSGLTARSMMFSPDGTELVVTYHDANPGRIRVYSVSGQTLTTAFSDIGPGTGTFGTSGVDTEYTPDGKFVYCTSNNGAHLSLLGFDAQNNYTPITLGVALGNFTTLSISPYNASTGKYIMTASGAAGCFAYEIHPTTGALTLLQTYGFNGTLILAPNPYLE